MTTHLHAANRTRAPHHFDLRYALNQIGKIVLFAILFLSFLWLGNSMVQHRFFRGGRIHQSGSVGE